MEKKKLYKSESDKKIAGVCGGIAEYLNVDSTIVRLIAIALIFAGTGGLWAYLVAALVMPSAPENGGYTPYTDYTDYVKKDN